MFVDQIPESNYFDTELRIYYERPSIFSNDWVQCVNKYVYQLR